MPSSSLFRLRPFRLLWTGQTISVFGDQVTLLALPLVAVLVLHAGPVQMGLLTAAGWTPHLFFALHAGAWIDQQQSRRRIMIGADLGRAAVIATVPIAHSLHSLTMGQLYVATFLVGVLTVFFDQSYSAFFQVLVPRGRFVQANGLLSTSRAASQVAGPSAAGLLVSALSAPGAMVVDAASFVGSAAFLTRISVDEPRVDRSDQAGTRSRIAQGMRFVLGQPLIRASLAAVTTINFFLLMLQALLILYLSRVLGFSAAVIGGLLAVQAVGGLAGAMIAPRLSRLVGLGPAIVAGAAVFPAALLLYPLAGASKPLAATLIAGGGFLSGIAVMVFDVNNNSLYALLIPYRLRARGSGVVRFFAFGIRPLAHSPAVSWERRWVSARLCSSQRSAASPASCGSGSPRSGSSGRRPRQGGG